jgi:hypothetical protein
LRSFLISFGDAPRDHEALKVIAGSHMSRLNPSLRLWLLFVLVFLASTASFMAVIWPQRDAAVVADLRSVECGPWRDAGHDLAADGYAQPGQPCYALRSLLAREHVALRSARDYDTWLAGRRLNTALGCLAVWAGFSAAIYALGWSSGRLSRALGRARTEGAGG